MLLMFQPPGQAFILTVSLRIVSHRPHSPHGARVSSIKQTLGELLLD